MKKKKIFKILRNTMLVILIASFIWTIPVIFHWNKGASSVLGTAQSGTLNNPYKMDLYGKNFSYFSYFSYFMLGMCFTSDRVYHNLKDCMKALESSRPGKHFYIMELSRNNGGKTLLHKTHRAGLSVDLMVPKLNSSGQQTCFYDHLGILHYKLDFDQEGKLLLDKSVQIDFESLAILIQELVIASAKNRTPVKRVIIRDEIRDNLFKTSTGSKLSPPLIISIPSNKFVNEMHDDHIHVDFAYQ